MYWLWLGENGLTTKSFFAEDNDFKHMVWKNYQNKPGGAYEYFNRKIPQWSGNDRGLNLN